MCGPSFANSRGSSPLPTFIDISRKLRESIRKTIMWKQRYGNSSRFFEMKGRLNSSTTAETIDEGSEGSGSRSAA